MGGIKRTSADNWFSLYVRARDKFVCQRCYKKYPTYKEGGDNRALQGLDCAHCFGRGNNMTRFEPDNALSCCYGCHSKIDSDPEEKSSLFIRKVGFVRYLELKALSKKPYKGIKRAQPEIAKKYRDLFRLMIEDTSQEH